MGFLDRFRAKSTYEDEDAKVKRICGINPKKATPIDFFVYGIVHFPIGIKKNNEYLSSNQCMLIDESIIAYKIATCQITRSLAQNHYGSGQVTASIKTRVQNALCELYDVPENNLIKQWDNRTRYLPLNFTPSIEEQLPKLIEKAALVLKQDYLKKNYEKITGETPELIIDFTEDMKIQLETKIFVSTFNETVQGMMRNMT